MTASDPAPRWMRAILLAAGAYNVVWGAFVVLFPTAMFRWLEMPLPNYPQLWQCIGMIVGVYGIGYAIAAFDPFGTGPSCWLGSWEKSLARWACSKRCGPVLCHGVSH